MIEFYEVYNSLAGQASGNQRKIMVESCLEVYFGYSKDNHMRLSFLSRLLPPTMESTKIIHVVQGKEGAEAYWTSFDLLRIDLKEAFLCFCENLIESIVGAKDERNALELLKRRFVTWKKLFQKAPNTDLSKEKVMGLLGELIVLKQLVAERYGIDEAVRSWGGSSNLSKDFSISDTWFEVKTVGANSDSISISSLTQLSSPVLGHLVVVKVEMVSPEYEGNSVSLLSTIKDILALISDETTENCFTDKIEALGIDVFGKEIGDKYDVKSIVSYSVGEGFPRITDREIPYPEIVGVNYKISIAALNRFAEN